MEQTKYSGLNDEQVIESRETHGANVVTPPQKEPLWKQYFESLKEPLIRILLIALALSIGLAVFQFTKGLESASVFLEPAGIAIAILLATGVGFIFTVSANNKFNILNQVNDDTPVKVIRNGLVCEVPKKEIVVGDIVLLETGDEIPADGKLLETLSLQVNESTLTGEPVTHKTVNEADFDAHATYPSYRVYKGTTVIDGHGIMEVHFVGDSTELGKVDAKSQEAKEIETPLNIQLTRLAQLISKVSYTIAGLIILIRVIFYFNGITNFDWIDFSQYLLHTIMIAVTLIVVTVPEGLPMAVTLSLAMSMKRMLATNNLVRKLHACETMGATTVICTDKTGTLTQNQMRVYETKFYAELNDLITEGIAANTTAYLDFSDKNKIRALGNPTEGALLLWLHEQNVNYSDIRDNTPIIDQLTFSTERKYMATLVESSTAHEKIVYVKGAPEILLSRCKNIRIGNEIIPIENYKKEIEQQLLTYQNQAMRTLGFAYQTVEESPILDGKLNDAVDLIFLGIIAISDPVRSDVPSAIAQCFHAGIQVKIVTGDTPGTAKEIGRQIGLWTDTDKDYNHLTGVEFAKLSDETLLDRILHLKILSRARPLDKERLVKLLQQKNQVVAVTGDGSNDAPALNAAQVGLSMGDGTSVAKEASDITIIDNSFHSIARAVMWGRSLYQNIQQFILFQMIINVAACLIVLIGVILGVESPLTVTQMLWVNLIMDTFAALALSSLPPNSKVMNNPPRKMDDSIITRKMGAHIFGIGILFVLILFGILQYFRHVEVESLTQFNFRDFFQNYFNFTPVEKALSRYELSMFFSFFVLLQFWNMFNAKAFNSGHSAFYQWKQSLTGFGMVTALILIGQIIIVNFGGEMFSVTPIQLIDWGIIIGSTSLVLLIGELIRWISRKSKI